MILFNSNLMCVYVLYVYVLSLCTITLKAQVFGIKIETHFQNMVHGSTD